MKTETPVRTKTARPVSLCSLRVAAQVSQEPRGPSGARSPRLPSRPPASLLFSSLMATGTGVIPRETQRAPKLGLLAQRGHGPVPWLRSHGQGVPRRGIRAPLIPDAQELGVLARGRGCTFFPQALHVCKGDDGGRDVPGEASDGGDDHQEGDTEEVQVKACSFLQ